MNVPLSILDLSPISEGSDAATALRNTVDLAQHAEQWGYRRYWLAEHHFVAVASSSPAVLIGQLAAATERIHVGAAAVQLGYTTAVATVESFGILDALHPGRIDLGVGRSGQRRREAAAAPDRTRPKTPPRVWHEVDDVVIPAPFDLSALMNNPRLKARARCCSNPRPTRPTSATRWPTSSRCSTAPTRWTASRRTSRLGSEPRCGRGCSAAARARARRVAAKFGLPFVASYHITPATALEAVEVYREGFQPSEALREPYVVVSADVVVADDTATAEQLASTYGHWVLLRSAPVDGAVPYPDPESSEPLTDEQRAVVKDRTATQFVGDPDRGGAPARRPAAAQRRRRTRHHLRHAPRTPTGCAPTS